jgi:hypothetical protein
MSSYLEWHPAAKSVRGSTVGKPSRLLGTEGCSGRYQTRS